MITEAELNQIESWAIKVGKDTKVYAIENILELVAEIKRLRRALRYYAHGTHQERDHYTAREALGLSND